MSQLVQSEGSAEQRAVTSPPHARALTPIATASATWVIGVYVALVLESPYMNDDLINKTLPSILRTTHQSLSGFIGGQISSFVTVDAHFFPGGLAWTYTLFDVFDERGPYKLVVGLALAIALVITALCIAALTKAWAPGAAFVLIVAGTLQIRPWADGITSFAGLMGLTLALTMAALLLLLSRPGRWWALLAGALYLLALLTYEAVFVLAPVLVLLIVLTRRDWRASIPIAVPAALALLTTLAMRRFAGAHPLPEYTLSFAPGPALSTFGKQLVAALPLSQWWLGDTHVPPIAGTAILASAFVVGVPVFLGLRHLADQLPRGYRPAALCGALGAWMWIAPALLISLTKRWQTGIPLGEGYISVVYEYVGVALCLLSLWLLLDQRLRNGNRRRALRLCGAASTVALTILATITFAANISVLP